MTFDFDNVHDYKSIRQYVYLQSAALPALEIKVRAGLTGPFVQLIRGFERGLYPVREFATLVTAKISQGLINS